MLLHGDNRLRLGEIADNSVDSIVTDPPYELGFMGKAWDGSGIAYDAEMWRQCLRILKPGGHILAFGSSRTYHRIACAIEDSGFEIRDQIMWIYGSGFPKSLNVSKSLIKQDENVSNADEWDGWGTALKPAHEPIVVARKPLDGTVAKNVVQWGTGAINIDACRIGYEDGEVDFDRKQRQQHSDGAIEGSFGAASLIGTEIATYKEGGRWPANVIHDGSEEVVSLFPNSKGGAYPAKRGQSVNTTFASGQETEGGFRAMGDSGSAARFFYCAKSSSAERNTGLDHLEAVPAGGMKGRNDGSLGSVTMSQNHHPTVKPISLMRYLVKLVTPKGGTVLDPFLGSGSTAVAAILEECNWIGCEITDEYIPIIEARVAHALAQKETVQL